MTRGYTCIGLHRPRSSKNLGVVLRSAGSFAVDLLEDAAPLPEYRHPERAFYVFGPENGTLDETVTAWCRDRVYVPTRRCLNLAAAVNIVLYDRFVKRGRAAT